MEESRDTTSSKSLTSTFDNILESPEAEINAIPSARSEKLMGRRSRDIPCSVTEMVYGGNEEGVGTFSKIIDRDTKLISSSETSLGPRKYTSAPARMD
ncbi:hypothetical protein O181_078345 [Austropuccinia psidii MF-1]|uniref:Uncharacterized protein n=1 Tax=Austropuccinia psidii MF-1 TaxID=1389203 RepID=A0A9Q3IGW0_9BASI|nr:hypothetical protein [Austropuccinia psidii MF-1]